MTSHVRKDVEISINFLTEPARFSLTRRILRGFLFRFGGGFLAPNETFPVGLTKYISLIIGIKIDPNAEETSSENTSSGNGA